MRMQGGGLYDLFRSPQLSNRSKNTLKKYGNLRVVQLIIVRAPVKKFVNKLFDVITLGQWSSLKKKYGYD